MAEALFQWAKVEGQEAPRVFFVGGIILTLGLVVIGEELIVSVVMGLELVVVLVLMHQHCSLKLLSLLDPPVMEYIPQI